MEIWNIGENGEAINLALFAVALRVCFHVCKKHEATAKFTGF